MPTPHANKAIVLMDSPNPIRIIKPGYVEKPIERCKSPYKLGLAWPPVPMNALNNFYEQLAICPVSELNRFDILHSSHRIFYDHIRF